MCFKMAFPVQPAALVTEPLGNVLVFIAVQSWHSGAKAWRIRGKGVKVSSGLFVGHGEANGNCAPIIKI